MRATLVLALLVSVVPASSLETVAARGASSPEPRALGPRRAPSRPNIVLVTLDTTRADHLGAWGWPHARTPTLDTLARRGRRFARCDTAAPITLPSHATILTGLLPPRHAVRDNGTFVLAPRFETLAERLRAAGYDTGAVVSAAVLARRHGLDQGFRVYDDDLGAGYTAGTEVGERPAAAATDAALALLPTLRAPWLLWVHYYDPHEEYAPPTRFADAARGPHRLYDGEIAYVDHELGRLLAAAGDDALVAVVGDHGEMLGEGGEPAHGLLLGAGARRVPFLLAGPGVPSGTEECLVRTADVAPTLLGLVGVELPAGLDGEALLGGAGNGGAGSGAADRGGEGAEHAALRCTRVAYAESFLPFFAYRWYPLRALSDGQFLLVHGPTASFYRIASDPAETHDLAATQPAAVVRWEERLRALLAAMGEPLEPEVRPENVLATEQRAQLESLGYLGGGAGGKVTRQLPDPRRMTDVARALDVAVADVRQGRCAAALPRLQAIVRRDRDNFPALSLAGECLRAVGREAEALAHFQHASRVNELSAVPVANAAGSLLRLGRAAEAETEYRRALALDPTLPEAAANLARILRGRGEGAAALRVLDEALAAGSHGPEVHLERGTALAEAGRLEEALRAFREAARRSPSDPLPLESAAKAAYHLGRAREAAQSYEALLRLVPERGDLWKTLGAIYRFELGEAVEAERCFRRALALERDPAERAQLEELLPGGP